MAVDGVRFAQISDVHIMAQVEECRCWWMPELPQAQLQQAIHQLNAIPDLDFVVFTGDLVDAADEPSFRVFEQIAVQLRIPYYLASGNHDLDIFRHRKRRRITPAPRFSRQDFLDWCLTQFDCQVAPTGFVDYHVAPCPGLRLLVLDATPDPGDHLPTSMGILRPQQLDWLEATLQQFRDDWILVVIHQPPFVARLASPLSPLLFRNYRLLPEQAEHLHQILRQHPYVPLVLSGHWHIPLLTRRHQINYLTAPGLVGPVPAFRVFDLDPQQGLLRYQWHRVELPASEPHPRPFWHSLVVGKPWDRRGSASIPVPPFWIQSRSAAFS